LYKINICGDCKERCKEQETPAFSQIAEDCLIIGTSNFEISLTDSANPQNGIFYVYKEGENSNRVTIQMLCDPTLNKFPEFNFLRIDYDGVKNFIFTLKSSAVCPTPLYGYLWPVGIGGILGLVAFSIFLLYCTGGCFLNFTIFNKRGRDVIPNLYFWKDVPFLIKDGFLFIFEIRFFFGFCFRKFQNVSYQEI
jgi:hypothetical protein